MSAGAGSHWAFEPWVVAPVAVSTLLYARGVWVLWRHAGVGRGISKAQVAFFAAGTLSLVLALMSPLDHWAEHSFAAHMTQHEILMLVTAPLMVLARPLGAWTWAFPPRARQAIGHGVRSRPWSRAWGVVTDPLAAWALHAAALWGWHIPSVFEAAVESDTVHAWQHTSFLATALLFWWAVLGAPARRSAGAALASLFTTMLHTSALGALLTLAGTPWYAAYGLEDQQLGGLIMWVPGATAYVVAALWIMARLLAPDKVIPAMPAPPGRLHSGA